MALKWYEKDEDRITDDYNNGLISYEEFKNQMRDLRNEVDECAREAAHEAAERAYNDYY